MKDMNFSHDQRSLAVSLNGLKAFESAARHLSFTAAAAELGVTQSAISHQIKLLEERLGTPLFRRTPRGLVVTDEALSLAPTLTETFERISRLLAQFGDGKRRVPLTVSVVGTFALGWLLPRLKEFEQCYPFVDLRLLTNNNSVDVIGEGLDAAIRFGDGDWSGVDTVRLIDADLSPLCSPQVAASISEPFDLAKMTLLRSFRGQDWLKWLKAAGLAHLPLSGPIFDSSILIAEAAARGHGVGILPVALFESEVANRRLVRPFELAIHGGSYWLITPKSREKSAAMHVFAEWLSGQAEIHDQST